jgi:3-phenylpropionate/trans-cinnamate dioxygenase ferredoxin subunit|tara:strand:- start:322 stop:639 length:318 start_codon:yes stop_codon:yes gene_type:complete
VEKVKVLKLSEITENSSRLVEIEDKKIAIFNVGGEIYAIDDICSHAEASLSEGEVFDCIVECPLHGAEFDLRTGEATTLPATKPVVTYNTDVDDEYLYLEVGEDV